ncbi:hypothetical protein [uncultured Methylobacterium sp.]|uniref:hypothetical protein n=1 Tax=uncultured Methylobacterium sp. TaxID=157278 RepID=UPI0035CAC06B
MNRVTLITRLGLAATALLSVALTSSAAEARFRGLRLRVGSSVARPPSPLVRQPERTAAGSPILLAPVVLAPSRKPEPRAPQPETGEAPAPERAPVQHPVHVAGPWCASNRVVGAGVGFCELN